MKKGISKKFLFGILSVLFMLGTFLIPTPKSDVAQAQSICTVTSARFIPSTINGSVDSRFVDNWYDEDTPPEFTIKAALKDCAGVDIGVEIVEEDSTINNTVDIGKNSSDSSLTNKIKSTVSSNDATLTFTFKAGSDECESLEYGPDCDLHFNLSANGSKIFSSTDNDRLRAQGGSLDYDVKTFTSNKTFVFVGVAEESGDTVGVIWYYALSDGKYTPSNGGRPTDEASCIKEASGASGAQKPVDCTDAPNLSDILGGALNGMSSAVPTCGTGIGVLGGGSIPACVTEVIYVLVFQPVSFLAGVAGQFFDLLFSFSISSEIYGGGGANVGFLKIGWTFVRDLANLGFIIALLWIAISQIITPGKDAVKKNLPRVVIIALLINFSFFFGTVIIDVTNVLARFLFTNNAICVQKGSGDCTGSISEGIVGVFNPQTMIERSSGAFQAATGQEEMSTAFYAIILIMSIFVSIKMLMMFFKMGTLFLGRIVQLWVLLVLSPVAFIRYIFPGKIGDSSVIADSPMAWASQLFKNAFIAPLFMFFLYLIFLIISKLDFAAISFTSTGTSSFIVLITMLFPFFVMIMLIEAAQKATQENAGKIANTFTGYINKAVGMVAGTALALTGTAALGAVTKGGGRILGGISKKMVGLEGKGSNTISRTFNKGVAKMGGNLNKYAKDLPNKNLDIRGNGLSNTISKYTGFDMNTNKSSIDKYLGYGGIKPSESFNKRNERKVKADMDDIERRKINEKTDKSDGQMLNEYNARQKDLEKNKERLDQEYKKRLASAEYEKSIEDARKKAFAEGKAFTQSDEDNLMEDLKNKVISEYKTKNAGSAELFDAQSKEDYTKAAKVYNQKVEKDFVDSKLRHVYGGKTEEETLENKKNDKQTMVNFAGAAGKTAGLTAAGSTLATGLGTAGIGLAGAAFYAAGAASKRDSDLAFLRKYDEKTISQEKEKKNSEAEKIKTEKIKKKIKEEEHELNNKNLELNEIDTDLKKLAAALTSNTETIKDLDGTMTQSFKEMFDLELARLTTLNETLDEKDREPVEIIERRAIDTTQRVLSRRLEKLRNEAKTKADSLPDGTAKDALTSTHLAAKALHNKVFNYSNKASDRSSIVEKIKKSEDYIDKLSNAIETKEEKAERKKKEVEESKKKEAEAKKSEEKK